MSDHERPDPRHKLLSENASPNLRDRIAKTLSKYMVDYVKGALAQSLLQWVAEKQGRRIVLEHGADGIEITFSQDGETVENPFLPGPGKTTIKP